MKSLAHSKQFITVFYDLCDDGGGAGLGLCPINKGEVTKSVGSQWCPGKVNQMVSPVTKIRRKKTPPTLFEFQFRVCFL